MERGTLTRDVSCEEQTLTRDTTFGIGLSRVVLAHNVPTQLCVAAAELRAALRNGDSSTEGVLSREDEDDEVWKFCLLSSGIEQETPAGGSSTEASGSLKRVAEACFSPGQ